MDIKEQTKFIITPAKPRKPRDTKWNGMSLSMSSKFKWKLSLVRTYFCNVLFPLISHFSYGCNGCSPCFIIRIFWFSNPITQFTTIFLCCSEEGHKNITSIVRNIYFLRYNMLMFLFSMCPPHLFSNKIRQVNLNYLTQASR